MKDLTGRLVGLLFGELSATVLGNPPAPEGLGGYAGGANRWDEALMASMHDENAHRLLDFWGPRRK
jgi:hypothetical protein